MQARAAPQTCSVWCRKKLKISWVVTGLDLPLCWNHLGKQRPKSIPFMQHICLCMPGRPPTLVLTGNFLNFSSITKSWRNWTISTTMRKFNWWLVSLFKQYISDFRQNYLVLITVDDFLSVDWVLDILEHRKVKDFICFCAGHTVARKYLASTIIQSIRQRSLGRPPKTCSVWYLCLT